MSGTPPISLTESSNPSISCLQSPSQTPPTEEEEIEESTKSTKIKKTSTSELDRLRDGVLWSWGYYDKSGIQENFDITTLSARGCRKSRATKIVNDNIKTQGPKFQYVRNKVSTNTKKQSSVSSVVHTKIRNKKKIKELVQNDDDPNVKTFGQLKKAWSKENKRPSGLLASLQADAEWFCAMDRDNSEPVEEIGPQRKLRKVRKLFHQEQADELERLRLEREKRKIKEHQEILEQRKINLAKMLEEKKRQQALERKVAADKMREVKKEKQRLKQNLGKKDEATSVQVTKKKIKKEDIYVSKTPVENIFGCKEEYYPFLLYIVVDNEKTPIDPMKFFTQEVISGEVSNITHFDNLVTASALLETRVEHYHDFPSLEGKERQRFKIKSCLFPDFEEEYISKGSLNHGDLDSFLEVGRIMELSAISYIPPQYQLQVFNKDEPSQSISGRFNLAILQHNWDKVFQEISNYNQLIEKIHYKNEFLPYIQTKNDFPKLAIHEILNQIYARSVLPESSKLKQYKGFSAQVYGELLPTFVSKLLVQTKLQSNSIFLDLGSGVGNVVLQAALEYSAESYGCEMMDNCADLAQKQLIEFEARSKLYGIQAGKVNLIHNDFTKSIEVKEILPKADVILITNFLFDDDLNSKVLKMLKPVKVGARIISLKPVVPDSFTYKEGDEDEYVAKLKVQRFEFGRDSVSWSGNTGFYYISEVTDTIQDAYKKNKNTRLTKIRNEVYTNIKTKKIPYSGKKFYEVIATCHANVPGTTFSQSSSRPMDDQFVSTSEIKLQRVKTNNTKSKQLKNNNKKLHEEKETENISLEALVTEATVIEQELVPLVTNCRDNQC